MSTATRRPVRVRSLVGFAITVFVVLAAARPASAHTDFDSSVPSDGAVVDGPLTEVVVSFTNQARPAGEGFELLDPDGVVRVPSSVDETDGTSFVLSFDPPLGAGTYGLRWNVQAGDAHPIDGSFQFEVEVPNPTTTAAPTTSPPSTTSTTLAPVGATSSTVVPAAGSPSLGEFLDASRTNDDSTPVGRVGRMISMLGVIFGVGVLAALVWTVRGHRDELVAQLAWVRLAGFAVFVGGLVEYAALADTDESASFTTLMATKPGIATALKMAGGLAVLIGFHERAGQFSAPAHSVSAAVATDRPARSDDGRWTPTSTAAVGLLGYAVVLVSFWFDGHTVSKGPWVVHSLVNLVHLGAAAVWVGGVFAMTMVAWMRHRRSEQPGLAAMVVRFSSLATISLVAVVVAGAVMAWIVLDEPGDVFATDWGRILVVKTALVAVAAGLGAFNHFRLRPALERRPDDPDLVRELRISLSVESTVFVAIVAVTAVLVASAT